jgi:hypothetical protein
MRRTDRAPCRLRASAGTETPGRHVVSAEPSMETDEAGEGGAGIEGVLPARRRGDDGRRSTLTRMEITTEARIIIGMATATIDFAGDHALAALDAIGEDIPGSTHGAALVMTSISTQMRFHSLQELNSHGGGAEGEGEVDGENEMTVEADRSGEGDIRR